MKIFIPLLILISFKVAAQPYMLPIDSLTKNVRYVDIVQADKSKDDIYKGVQRWIAKSFVNYKSVVQTENIETGLFVLKSKYQIPQPSFIKSGHENIHFTITIDCRDKKYRAIVDEFVNKVDLGEDFIELNVNNALVVDGATSSGKPLSEDSLKRFRAKNELINIEISELLSSLKLIVLSKDDF